VLYSNVNQRIEFVVTFYEQPTNISYFVTYNTIPFAFTASIGEEYSVTEYQALVCSQTFPYLPPPTYNIRANIQNQFYVMPNPATCTPITSCKMFPANVAFDYECIAPTTTSNRVCCSVSICTVGSEYQTVAPTNTSNRQCAPVTTCAPGYYQVVAPTATSDRVCSNVSYTVCNFNFQYEEIPPTVTTDRVCGAITFCNSSQFTIDVATSTSNTFCGTISTCVAPEVEIAPPTSTSDRVCAVTAGGKIMAVLVFVLAAIAFNIII